ncbi:MAG: response regulator transcription factor [Anaerolineae bacterium]|nr:MAG: response regulator transcription factor [Anaerolineae bacterium]
MPKRIRVLIADDHTIVRSGLHLLLESEADIEVVGEATDGVSAVSLAKELLPDIVLMDIGMPELNGIEATRQIKENAANVAILILTMHRSDEYFFQALEAGASGYVLKGAESAELIQAVRAVASGGVFLYPSVARQLVQQYLSQTEIDPPGGHRLTHREREIMKLIAEGYTTKEIAEQLVVSPSTVHSHRGNLMQKLNLSKRHELVEYARRHGFLHGT